MDLESILIIGDKMAQGKVVRLVRDKGFGFIKADGYPNEDIFFHRSGFETVTGFDQIKEGDRLEFEVGPGQKGPRADNIKLL